MWPGVGGGLLVVICSRLLPPADHQWRPPAIVPPWRAIRGRPERPAPVVYRSGGLVFNPS